MSRPNLFDFVIEHAYPISAFIVGLGVFSLNPVIIFGGGGLFVLKYLNERMM